MGTCLLTKEYSRTTTWWICEGHPQNREAQGSVSICCGERKRIMIAIFLLLSCLCAVEKVMMASRCFRGINAFSACLVSYSVIKPRTAYRADYCYLVAISQRVDRHEAPLAVCTPHNITVFTCMVHNIHGASSQRILRSPKNTVFQLGTTADTCVVALAYDNLTRNQREFVSSTLGMFGWLPGR